MENTVEAFGVRRAGLYAWGGPGTIRLLKAKYHFPRINEASFMALYEPAYLHQARQTLGVTDAWVTYSWGFSDATEQEDRDYIVRRLENFQREGIATYAYVQGLNLVTNDFKHEDVFCRDRRGRLLLYSKGRSYTCPNNPNACAVIINRVQRACGEAFDGIYVDNMLFGLPPFFFRRDYTSFFGCSCSYCQRRFRAEYGYDLPLDTKVGEDQIGDYLKFRCDSVYDLLRPLSAISREAGKSFGINLYDPYWFTPEVFFGYRLSQIAPLLDYFLVENHGLSKPSGIDNTHLKPLINSTTKPVFVVSYRDGIGFDPAYTQTDIDTIWSEAAALGYSPCLKGTEYITRGRWHALDIAPVRRPTIEPVGMPASSQRGRTLKKSLPVQRVSVRLASRYYAGLMRLAFANRYLAALLTRLKVYTWLARTCRRYAY